MCRLCSALTSAAAVLVVLLSAGQTLHAQTPESVGSDEPSGLFAVIKRFDFDERPLGNFEETPMYWEQLSGAGLPRYSDGRFDDQIGHDAPPAFRIDLRGGSTCYEYRFSDINVLPGADYRVSAYVRCVGLEHSRALLQIYIVDRFGERVEGSDRISRIVSPMGTSPETEPWQRLEAVVSGNFPDAFALRLRLWVLQDYAWHDPAAGSIDPIVRQDVSGTVWFDDVVVYRLPRARLHLSTDGNIVQVGETPRLKLDLHNSSPHPVATELEVLNASGESVFSEQSEVPAHATHPLETELPPLPTGLYDVYLYLHADGERYRYRSVRFAVVPTLPEVWPPPSEFGIDFAGPPRADRDGAVALARELCCGAIKIGVPVAGVLDVSTARQQYDDVRALAHDLIRNRIDVTGVLETAAGESSGADEANVDLLRTPNAEELFGPALTSMGGLIRSWQLGEGEVRAAAGERSLNDLRNSLRRYVTAPEVVLSVSALDPRSSAVEQFAASADAVSIRLPSTVPTRVLPRQLAPSDESASQISSRTIGRWLEMDSPEAGVPTAQRIAETARRLVIARALGLDRVYVPAPFELSESGGAAAWQPTEDYIALRTLYHVLGGKRAVAAMPMLQEHAIAIVFVGERDTAIVAWTWRDQAIAEPVELYLGSAVKALDLLGQPIALNTREGRTLVPLRPQPILLTSIEAPLARLQASFRVAPTYVQRHDIEPASVLSFENHFDQELSGTIEFVLPPYWRIAPKSIGFKLAPGERFSHALSFTLPPREYAGARPVGIRVQLNRPVTQLLDFRVPITVGLRDVQIDVRTHWNERTLVVEQSLHNESLTPMSFSAFCQAPQRRQLERAFLDIAPGETRVEVYEYSDADDLVGAVLRLGVHEIRGPRSLDQLVEVTP